MLEIDIERPPRAALTGAEGTRAAELLSFTRMFNTVDHDRLEDLCRELAVRGQIDWYECPAGTTIYS
ncbi:MAG TPA: hypothetical protein VHL09_16450, partial [Dehalococcoidia bacterium]|nr:hypothetical protein [Dehalococcoidia bacterium]